MARRTKKLMAACDVLADERFCDTLDEIVYQAIAARKITQAQVYKACHHFGYRWDRRAQEWKLVYPSWILNFYKIENFLNARSNQP